MEISSSVLPNRLGESRSGCDSCARKMNKLVLSLFPGIGLLDDAFEKEGFCVVRGPDLLWGGCIKSFHPPAGVFCGVIGGPPCQAHVGYAAMNRYIGNKVGEDLIPEFVRVVSEANPDWFLMENSASSPDVFVSGYGVQIIALNAALFGLDQDRSRKFQFGSPDGLKIRPDINPIVSQELETACLASEGKSGVISNYRRNGKERSVYSPRRSWSRFCQLQGLPGSFLEDSPFTLKGRYKVVGNGVPLPMGKAIAKSILKSIETKAAIKANGK